jgi:flagellar biosynthetic protein FliR
MDLSALTGLYGMTPLAILVFTRIVALFVAGPIIGATYVPLQVKALLAVSLTAMLVPGQLARTPPPAVDLLFLVLLAKEAMVGLTLGFFLQMFVQAIRFGGDLANRHVGYSGAEYFDPETDAAASPIGDLVNLSAMLLFFLLDGHRFFIAALARSYEFVPLGGWTMSPRLYDALIEGSQQMWIIALALSFPVLGAIMAVTVAEAVIVRAVPQINFLHFSFAVKILVGLMVLYAGLPASVAFLGLVLTGMQEAGYALLRAMG